MEIPEFKNKKEAIDFFESNNTPKCIGVDGKAYYAIWGLQDVETCFYDEDDWDEMPNYCMPYTIGSLYSPKGEAERWEIFGSIFFKYGGTAEGLFERRVEQIGYIDNVAIFLNIIVKNSTESAKEIFKALKKYAYFYEITLDKEGHFLLYRLGGMFTPYTFSIVCFRDGEYKSIVDDPEECQEAGKFLKSEGIDTSRTAYEIIEYADRDYIMDYKMFWEHTAASWTPCEKPEDLGEPADVSPRGSKYFFKEDECGEYVIRYAAIWGWCDDCYWILDGEIPETKEFSWSKCYLNSFIDIKKASQTKGNMEKLHHFIKEYSKRGEDVLRRLSEMGKEVELCE
ncbi:hypothetical protein [Bacteroides pyogenes]|uniref:hypothetical protein n=1 Tax=Bacteroides pyogenes TaxID=310300 RepID=UPI001BAB3122|nr:hypothetical protein [Bacteroides pyogenes]MBR8739038.1 hypothetical protein [Bacteroides pyogenes]MBR8754816.1 hypothetical protein [Bacteroides pyogenes]MBR8809691.1 hypothetical protein [Bacteroides pyogenes]